MSDAAVDAGAVLRQRAPFIAIVATAAALAIAVYIAVQPRQYEATTTLLAYQSKLGDTINPPVAVANYLPLVLNPTVVAEVIAELKLNEPPRDWRVASFLRYALFANPLAGTSLLEVRVRLDTPELAARAANGIADRAVARGLLLSQDEAGGAQSQVKAMFDDAKGRYEKSLADLAAFRQTAQIELLRKEVDGLLDERKANVGLALQLQGDRARLEVTEAEIKKRPRIDVVTRSIDSAPALLEAVRPAVGGNVLDVKMRDQQVSEVHESLDRQVAELRSAIAGHERRLEQARRVAGAEGEAKLTRLIEAERELEQRQTNVDVAEKAYLQSAGQYESARLQVSSRSPQLQVVAQAYPPEDPMARGLVLNAMLFFVLGAAAAAMAVLALAYLKSPV
jgi:uncharacterized protein involved in exopolysaccharide biosynthesis